MHLRSRVGAFLLSAPPRAAKELAVGAHGPLANLLACVVADRAVRAFVGRVAGGVLPDAHRVSVQGVQVVTEDLGPLVLTGACGAHLVVPHAFQARWVGVLALVLALLRERRIAGSREAWFRGPVGQSAVLVVDAEERGVFLVALVLGWGVEPAAVLVRGAPGAAASNPVAVEVGVHFVAVVPRLCQVAGSRLAGLRGDVPHALQLCRLVVAVGDVVSISAFLGRAYRVHPVVSAFQGRVQALARSSAGSVRTDRPAAHSLLVGASTRDLRGEALALGTAQCVGSERVGIAARQWGRDERRPGRCAGGCGGVRFGGREALY